MRRRGLQLSWRHRLMLYTVSAVLLVSGVAWAWIQRLDESESVSDTLRVVKSLLLKTHGFAAVGFVLLLGTLLSAHVRRSWQARKNRSNGGFFFVAVSLLTLSGYALYYLGDEAWRKAVSGFHFWLGVLAPFLLVWHIRSGKRETMGK